MPKKNIEMKLTVSIHAGGFDIEKVAIHQIGEMEPTVTNQLMGLEAYDFSSQLQAQLKEDIFNRMVSD